MNSMKSSETINVTAALRITMLSNCLKSVSPNIRVPTILESVHVNIHHYEFQKLHSKG